MYLLLQIYIITVIFSMMVIFSLKLLIESNESIRKKAIMLIEKGKEQNGINNDSGDVLYMWEVMIPVVNVAMSCFFIWIIFTDEENIKKLLEDMYDKH